MSVRADLELALTLATRADEITMGRFGALDLRIDTKPDLTPVTDADEAVEADIRSVLARERPGDAIFGEEQGGTPIFQGRQWVVDPIDGTKNFVRGVPLWASLIALLDDGVPIVGQLAVSTAIR
jgi:histidinol-phosphatase